MGIWVVPSVDGPVDTEIYSNPSLATGVVHYTGVSKVPVIGQKGRNTLGFLCPCVHVKNSVGMSAK